MDPLDLRNRFDYHPPKDEATRTAHEQVRGKCLELAEFINDTLPDGREKSTAITNLEQVMMWSNAGIARPQLPRGDHH
jgi:hypothetical protein